MMGERPIVDRAVRRIFLRVEELLAKRWWPTMTRSDQPHEVVLSFELHGVAREQLDIAVRRGRLECSGYHPVRRTVVRSPRASSVRFRHSIALPGDADLSRIETTKRDGLLEVRVARRIAPTPLA
jgi:HSP20 family molecular chaperone IbpA